MTVANWKLQSYNVVQSLLFNNKHQVIEYHVRSSGDLEWRDRAMDPAPVRRLYETKTTDERTCLHTIQFVHHMLIPPAKRHVEELHIHPDAEEIVVVTRGQGRARIGNNSFEIKKEDVLHVPPNTEHEIVNNGEDFLGVLFINVPVGKGIEKLVELKKDSETIMR